MNQNSLKNLKPAFAGEVRNPNGRPKGSLNTKTILKQIFGAKEKIIHPITKKEVRLNQLQIMTLALLKEARSGNVPAYNALMDRYEGKAEQKQQIAFEEGAAQITVRIGKAE
jgi:hypothetical protein